MPSPPFREDEVASFRADVIRCHLGKAWTVCYFVISVCLLLVVRSRGVSERLFSECWV